MLLEVLPSGKTQLSAAAALAQLCGTAVGQHAVAQGIPQLLSLLNGVSVPVQVAAAAAIANVVRGNAEGQGMLQRSGGIPPLLALLTSRSEEAQAQALRALAHLTCANHENQEAVARMGGVGQVVGLLGSSSGKLDVLAKAAFCLAGVCRGSPDNQALAAEAGALDCLVKQLRLNRRDASHASPSKPSDQAAGASASEAGQPVTAESEVLHAAADGRVLSGEAAVEHAQAEAAGALWALSDGNEANQIASVQAGAIAPLIGLLAVPGPQERAANALCCIARSIEDNQVSIASQLIGLLKQDVSTIHSPMSVPAYDKATRCLWRLVEENSESHARIAQAGAASDLILLLRSNIGEICEYVLWACTLMIDSACQQTVLDDGGLPPLIEAAKAASATSRERAAASLARLAFNSTPAQAAIADAGGVAPLLEILKGNRGDGRASREYATEALAELAMVQTAHAQIVKAAPFLVRQLEEADERGKQHAACALSRLCSEDATAVSAGVGSRSRSASAGKSRRAGSTGMHGSLGQHGNAASTPTFAATSEVTVDAPSDAPSAAEGEATVSSAAADGAPDAAASPDGTSSPSAASAVPTSSAAVANDGAAGSETSVGRAGMVEEEDSMHAHVLIADAGAIPPLVDLLLSDEMGESVQEAAAGALYSLASNARNRLAIASAGGIGPLVALLGSTNATARERGERALVRLSIEKSNRDLIIAKLVSMLGSVDGGRDSGPGTSTRQNSKHPPLTPSSAAQTVPSARSPSPLPSPSGPRPDISALVPLRPRPHTFSPSPTRHTTPLPHPAQTRTQLAVAAQWCSTAITARRSCSRGARSRQRRRWPTWHPTLPRTGVRLSTRAASARCSTPSRGPSRRSRPRRTP